MNQKNENQKNISENTQNTGASPAFIEKILGLGLSLMTEDTRRKRMERVVAATETMTTIDGQAFAALIDECRDALRLLVEEGDTTAVSQEQLNEVKAMLSAIDGKKAVACMEPDALVELVADYRKSVK